MPSQEERDQIISVAPPDPERDHKLATLEEQIEKVKAGLAPADSLRGVRVEPIEFLPLTNAELPPSSDHEELLTEMLNGCGVPLALYRGTPKCCENDTDGDGNCPSHAAPGMYRIGYAIGESAHLPSTEPSDRSKPCGCGFCD